MGKTIGWIVEDTKKSSTPTVNETVEETTETVETEKPKAKKTAKK